MRWQQITITVQGGDRAGEAARKQVDADFPQLRNKKLQDVVALYDDRKRSTARTADIILLLQACYGDGVKFDGVDAADFPPMAPPPVRRRGQNVVRTAPRYEVTLELGDLNAIFDPFDPAGVGDEPWKIAGVTQRLQALGYLYAPLKHSKIAEYARAGWEYFKRVHADDPETALSDTAAAEKLKLELQNHIVAGKLPDSGEILPPGALPADDKRAAIRFPGGYATTSPNLGYWKVREGAPTGGNDAKYAFPVGGRRDEAESAVWTDNPCLGKIPIVATVHKILSDGTRELATKGDVKVYFQLIDPLPPSINPGDPLRDPVLRNTVMDGSVDPTAMTRWLPAPPEIKSAGATAFTPTPEEWRQAKEEAGGIVKQARTDSAQARAKTDAEVKEIDDKMAAAKGEQGNANRKLEPLRKARSEHDNVTLRPYNDALEEKTKALNVEKEKGKTYRPVPILENIITPPPPPRLNIVRKPGAVAGPPKKTAEEIAADQARARVELADRKAWQTRVDALQDQVDAVSDRLNAERANIPPFPRQPELDATKRQFDDAQKKISDLNALRVPAVASQKSAITQKRDELFKAKRDAEGETNRVRAVGYIIATANSQALTSDLNLALESDPARPTTLANAGPKKFVDDLLARVEADCGDAKNPQRRNAPFKWGGKALKPVLGNIFEDASRRGFNDGHGKYGELKVVAAAPASKHPHAVVSTTNDKGCAGVIFMPSRCGGDRYRLRAYVWPKENKSGSPVFDTRTGTMAVWRNIRLSKYLRQSPGRRSARLDQLYNEADALADRGVATAERPATYSTWGAAFEGRAFLSTGAPPLALGKDDAAEPVYPRNDPARLANKLYYRPMDHSFVSLAENLRRGYCELIADCDGPQPIPQIDLNRAFAAFIEAFDNLGANLSKVHWPTLAFVDVDSPFLLNLRHFEAYNEEVAAKKAAAATAAEFATYPSLTKTDCEQIASSFSGVHGIQPIAEVLMDGGIQPGFTIVQVTHGDTWDHNGFGFKQMFTSGWAQTTRGCFVFYSDQKQRNSMCYSASANVAHEMGHTLMLSHQPPNPGGDEQQHEPQAPAALTRPAAGQTNCVMGYSGCFGEYCGKCVMALRGWRLKQTKWQDPLKMDASTGVSADGV